MFGWSLNLFRVRGIQLSIHGSFFLLLAWIARDGWVEGRGEGLLWSILVLLAFFGCVVLHELGHSFTAMHYGIGVRRILLMPIGGMAEFDAIPRQPGREFLITLAGPAVNFVIAGGLWFIVRGFGETVESYSFPSLIGELFLANLIMGCFNLLPAFPMDGGRILRALLATRLPYLRATFWAATLGKIVCVAAIGLCLWVHWEGWWLTAVLFAFIAFVGEAEYRAVKRREIEDAHWREALARLRQQPSAIEPPFLAP